MATQIGGIDIIFKEANHDFSHRWHQFNPDKVTLPKGWRKEQGRRALTEDIIFESDVAVPLRDGVTIYADVFRPISSEGKPVPAILAWSPYGKQGNGLQSLDRIPWRMGVAKDKTSDLEKFEALDPAEWCPRGYAIVNVDSRGVFDSEGDMFMLGTQEGRDGYDAVEFLALKPWCNGSLAFAGNSYLAAVQWFIAAERPPHLTAIAPWEGFADSYRELICRGGIPNNAFVDARASGYCGKNLQEDSGAMIRKYPLWNDYWASKRPRLADIECPMYVLASFSSCLHTEGSIRGFLFASSKEKWLRIHHTQEWHDLYQDWVNDDLAKFFDHYLLGIENDWAATPAVRHSLLGFNRDSVVNRADTSYPPDYVKHQTFYLDGSRRKLTSSLVGEGQGATVSYTSDSWDDQGAHFAYTFPTYTELIGFSQVKLFMSCPEASEMDVYVVIRKLDADGKPLLHVNVPLEDLPAGTSAQDIPNTNIFKYLGPSGRLRASHRELGSDPTLIAEQTEMLRPATAWHPHDKEDAAVVAVVPGDVVCLDIPLWPSGMIFEAGESMRLDVMGHEPLLPEFMTLDRVPKNLNRGKHFVHTGREYPSSVTVSLNY